MTELTEALWLRALHVADARGLLPAMRFPLTPGELAAEAARRGEDRLTRLVDGWYYPASYGRGRGVLSDEEANRLVASLEAEIAPAEIARPEITLPQVESPPPHRDTDCDLCGFPITPETVRARRVRR